LDLSIGMKKLKTNGDVIRDSNPGETHYCS